MMLTSSGASSPLHCSLFLLNVPVTHLALLPSVLLELSGAEGVLGEELA